MRNFVLNTRTHVNIAGEKWPLLLKSGVFDNSVLTAWEVSRRLP